MYERCVFEGMGGLSMRWGMGRRVRVNASAPAIALMSLAGLSLGGLLASRARLRLARHYKGYR